MSLTSADTEAWRQHWNLRHSEHDQLPPVADVLADNAHLLPAGGDALDVACGLGANAFYLAARGFQVSAWDIADVAIAKLSAAVQQTQATIHASRRDLVQQPPLPNSFDVIVVHRFLVRELAPALSAALRPQGLLFYQTFVQEKVTDHGPKTTEFLLAANELQHLFADLHLLVYREEGRVGNCQQGFRNQALLVAQRR